MTNVLLVAPWAPSSLAFARSLQRQGIGVYLLQPATARRSPQRSVSALQGSATIHAHLVGTRAGIDFIKRYIDDIGASALVAIIDRELLSSVDTSKATIDRQFKTDN